MDEDGGARAELVASRVAAMVGTTAGEREREVERLVGDSGNCFGWLRVETIAGGVDVAGDDDDDRQRMEEKGRVLTMLVVDRREASLKTHKRVFDVCLRPSWHHQPAGNYCRPIV
jgi:hypothetical protein